MQGLLDTWWELLLWASLFRDGETDKCCSDFWRVRLLGLSYFLLFDGSRIPLFIFFSNALCSGLSCTSPTN